MRELLILVLCCLIKTASALDISHEITDNADHFQIKTVITDHEGKELTFLKPLNLLDCDTECDTEIIVYQGQSGEYWNYKND